MTKFYFMGEGETANSPVYKNNLIYFGCLEKLFIKTTGEVRYSYLAKLTWNFLSTVSGYVLLKSSCNYIYHISNQNY